MVLDHYEKIKTLLVYHTNSNSSNNETFDVGPSVIILY